MVKGIASILSLLLIVFFTFPMQAQDAGVVKDSKTDSGFIFIARTAIPTSGSTRQLTGDYDVKVTSGSVVSYLPYFGRAYASSGQEGGIKFTSKDFRLQEKAGKKGRREISIKILDVPEVRQLNFSITENGYGSLQVISNNRQPISFYGEVKNL